MSEKFSPQTTTEQTPAAERKWLSPEELKAKKELIFVSIEGMSGKSRNTAFRRVFLNSVQDGLELAERIHMDPQIIAGNAATPEFVFKHPQLAHKLMLKRHSNVLIESELANDGPSEARRKNYLEYDGASNLDKSAMADGFKQHSLKEKTASSDPALTSVLNTIDDYYANFLRLQGMEKRKIPGDDSSRKDTLPKEEKQERSGAELADSIIRYMKEYYDAGDQVPVYSGGIKTFLIKMMRGYPLHATYVPAEDARDSIEARKQPRRRIDEEEFTEEEIKSIKKSVKSNYWVDKKLLPVNATMSPVDARWLLSQISAPGIATEENKEYLEKTIKKFSKKLTAPVVHVQAAAAERKLKEEIANEIELLGRSRINMKADDIKVEKDESGEYKVWYRESDISGEDETNADFTDLRKFKSVEIDTRAEKVQSVEVGDDDKLIIHTKTAPDRITDTQYDLNNIENSVWSPQLKIIMAGGKPLRLVDTVAVDNVYHVSHEKFLKNYRFIRVDYVGELDNMPIAAGETIDGYRVYSPLFPDGELVFPDSFAHVHGAQKRDGKIWLLLNVQIGGNSISYCLVNATDRQNVIDLKTARKPDKFFLLDDGVALTYNRHNQQGLKIKIIEFDSSEQPLEHFLSAYNNKELPNGERIEIIAENNDSRVIVHKPKGEDLRYETNQNQIFPDAVVVGEHTYICQQPTGSVVTDPSNRFGWPYLVQLDSSLNLVKKVRLDLNKIFALSYRNGVFTIVGAGTSGMVEVLTRKIETSEKQKKPLSREGEWVKWDEWRAPNADIGAKLHLLATIDEPTEARVREYYEKYRARLMGDVESPFRMDPKSGKMVHKDSARLLPRLKAWLRDYPEEHLHYKAAVPDDLSDAAVDRLFFAMYPEVLTALKKQAAEQRRTLPTAGMPMRKRLWNVLFGDRAAGLPARANEVNPGLYLQPREEVDLKGGDPSEKPENTLVNVEARQNTSGFFMYSDLAVYDDETRMWKGSDVPLESHTSEPTKEETFTVQVSAGQREVVLPLRAGSTLIAERVVGALGKKQIPLRTQRRNGVMVARITDDKITHVTYSTLTSELPLVPRDISVKEYDTFYKNTIREHGKGLVLPLVKKLSPEDQIFLESIKDLNPKEKLSAIQQRIQSSGYYDMKNGEVNTEKAAMSIDDQLATMAQRTQELRRSGTKVPADKTHAGVCSDFALYGTTLLREAGFIAGIHAGYLVQNAKKMHLGDAHAVSSVLWPAESGVGIVSIEVDMTPGNGSLPAEMLKRIQQPTLAEQEKSVEKIIDKINEETRKELAHFDSAHQTEIARGAANGVLEKLLNQLLREKVFTTNVQDVKRALDVASYSPVNVFSNDIRDPNAQIEYLKFVESELSAQAKEREKQTVVVDLPAGSELVKISREFLERYQKNKPQATRAEAGEVLLKVYTLLGHKEHFKPDMQNALIALARYLQAGNMVGKR